MHAVTKSCFPYFDKERNNIDTKSRYVVIKERGRIVEKKGGKGCMYGRCNTLTHTLFDSIIFLHL